MRPKPMIEIGGRPILWHIMHTFAAHGASDFIICLGYRGYMIKEYFTNYRLHQSDVTVDLQADTTTYHNNRSEPWRVTLVDTGPDTLTGGRLKRVRSFLDQDEPFLLTYGDGLADLDVTSQVAFHRTHGLLATMTVVRPPARFGAAKVADDKVVGFEEKPHASSGYINGGFFVLQPEVIDLIQGDRTAWEHEPLVMLSQQEQMAAWHHDGFWQPMDTLREKEYLEDLWASGAAPWTVR